jgi:hypothetical protein
MPYVSEAQRKAVWASKNELKNKRNVRRKKRSSKKRKSTKA